MKRLVLFLAFLIFPFGAGFCGAPLNFTEVAKKAVPAVVYVETVRLEGTDDIFEDELFRRFFGAPPNGQESKRPQSGGRGSGFLISPDGHILTNYHVIFGAKEVRVRLESGKTLSAKVLGTDPRTDVALVKVEGQDFPYLEFGDSTDLQVGEWVVAIGNPLGLRASLTAGVVSAKGRSDLEIADLENFIQTDAAINPGNSGGPLLNLQAEVVGMNTAIASTSGGSMGIGFAIPSNVVSYVKDQLETSGMVTQRGYLGISLRSVDFPSAQRAGLEGPKGVMVVAVVPGSPAQMAGLENGDIILQYDKRPAKSVNHFRQSVALMDPQYPLSLTVIRNGKMLILEVPLSVSPESGLANQIGLQVDEFKPQLADQLGLDSDQRGVIVKAVLTGSPAYKAGLRPGTLIQAVDGKAVDSVESFNKVLSMNVDDQELVFMVNQRGKTSMLTLSIQRDL